jgi:uncharacterized membrane protein YoaK (UPF0700 family)
MTPSVTAIDPHAGAPVPSVDSTLATRLIPGLLSIIAGSTDVISFLGLAGLFTAHITGNLVVLAAHITTGQPASMAAMLSVPVFMVVLGVSRVLAAALEWIGAPTLQPFLLIQFLLLAGFLFARIAGGPELDPNAALEIFAGMLGVAAMAVQNTLAQISLKGAPSTAVMTTNITRFMMDIGEVLLGRDVEGTAKARRRAKHTWPAILGFAAGCVLGAACEASFGLWSLTLPTGLALLALAMAAADMWPRPQRSARA